MRAFIIVVLSSVTLIAQQGPAQVTAQDLLDGLKDPTKWLTYSGTYDGHRHSPLTQITPENVGQLTAQWTFQPGVLGTFQATPIVIDGVIYITGWNNTAFAIDARWGAPSGDTGGTCRTTCISAVAPSIAVSACSAIACS